MTYTVDTVVVDPGEDFFNVGYGLGAMGLTSDQSYLLFFENDPLKLVRVNLNELELLSKTDFEREGPHGIGSYISNMQVESKDELLLLTNITASIFNSEGKIIRALKTIPSGIEEELAQDFNFLYSAAIYDSKENKIYSTPSSSKTGNNELFVIDLEQNTAKSIPIPNMKIMDDMSILFALAPGKNALFRYHPQQKFVSLIGDQLLISSNAMSGIYSYHTQRDSLEFIDVQHQTEPNKMELSITNKPTEEATFLEDQRKVSAHINYMEPKWDASREMFFRLGKKTFMPEDKNDPTTYEL